MSRAQLSLEFMVYLSLAGLSLLSSLSLLGTFSGHFLGFTSKYEVLELVNNINLHAMLGITGNTTELVPKGLCGAAVIGSSLISPYGNFPLVGKISASNGTFCPSSPDGSLLLRLGTNQTFLEKVV
ncbi:MAG: hypothetical protein KGH53_00830 [Candidatus Micrarchaeota archaeon]|nr:hypothetical protein [Candidatus Micrarchaeota archaeon]